MRQISYIFGNKHCYCDKFWKFQINMHRIQSELVSGRFLLNISETNWNSEINDSYGAANAKPMSFRLHVAETLVVKWGTYHSFTYH
jgi:hypothetical protein